MDTILILDFGGQSCHLISRRLRDFGVYAEVLPSDYSAAQVMARPEVKGIILSGGARSVYEKNAPEFDPAIFALKMPIFGICYGHQLLAKELGGTVTPGEVGEYGPQVLTVLKKSGIFSKLGVKQKIWMNHKDIVTKVPKGFTVIGKTSHKTQVAAYSSKDNMRSGVQFHPEVSHTEHGDDMLKNFALTICKAKPTYSSANLLKDTIKEARDTMGAERAVIGLSGGVDSSVAAALVARAIGEQLTAVYVDTGLMREGETTYLRKAFGDKGLKLIIVDAAEEFFGALKGVTDPEEKRKIIGTLFVRIFEREAKKADAQWLIQGTIYSDRIESGLTKHSSNIKSHHNVGGLPKDLGLKLYEPLRDLYKDEVRTLAKTLKLPKEITDRQVFPGPGLAIRIIGEVTRERAEIVRKAGHIIESELMGTKHWKDIWMSFGVFLPVQSVGISGDERSYKHPLVLRIVESRDAMSANFAKLPYEILENISTRLTNEIKEINRVVYDITNKPPATMEWE
jgi:GMP synthase (glutamine-hydrolysing)